MAIQPELGFFYTPPRRPEAAPALSPIEQQNYMAGLIREGGNTIETIGKVLDTPGAILRGALAGDPASGFSWDSDRRVTGEELLEQYGVLKKDDSPWLKTPAGLAAEIALDPLAMISGPLRALNPAGKAARAAGILSKAPDAALARVGIDDASKTLTGAATRKWAKAAELPETAETFSVRPLIGQRQAQMGTTLDELVQFVDQGKAQKEAFENVSNYLAQRGLRYEDVADQKLSGAFGLGYFSPAVTFTPPGSEKFADVLDRAGQAIAWSPVSRGMSMMFDNRVNDTFAAGDQVEAIKHSRYVDDAMKEGRKQAARHAMAIADVQLSPQAKTMLGADSLLSEKGNDFLTRLFENTQTKSDELLKRAIGPSIDNVIASWDAIRKQNVALGQYLGLDVMPYRDTWEVLYSPRTAAEADFGEYGQGLSRSLFNTRMLEQKARQEYLQVPGGTVDLREVSLLPKVDDFARNGKNSQYTIAEVGKEIREYLNNKHASSGMGGRSSPPKTMYKVTQEQGEKIASFMQRLDPRRPAGLPVFSEHPISAQARNIVSQNLARANAAYIYDSMAEAAIETSRSDLPGAFKAAGSALNDIARATGLKMDEGLASAAAQTNLREAIAKRLGKNVADIDLNAFSIPETVYNRLHRIQSFYSSPRAQQAMFEGLDKFSSLFKGFVLAWPARFTRDMYSNTISILLENGSVPDTLYGLSVAKKIVNGNFDEALQYLRELPGYQNLADPQALRRKFIEDAAGSGILQTLASNDLLTANRVGDVAQLVPGSTPMRGMDALRELGGNWGNFFQVKDVRFPWQSQSAYETLNPVLNASQKASDFIDSIGRLGGYISLLRQGVAPDMAAKRMTEALVDYSSLTTMERGFFRAIFPWWAYNSRIGKYVVQSLASNPGGSYAQMLRTLGATQRSDKDTHFPEGLRQQFTIRVPEFLEPILGVKSTPENIAALRDFDAPGVDTLSLLSLQDTFRDSFKETAYNILNQASPIIRAPLEHAFDLDLFSRRPLKEAVTALDRIYMRASGATRPMDPVARSVLTNIPGLQRPISLFGGLSNTDIPLQERIATAIINSLLGVKIAHVDKEWILNDLRRKNARKFQNYTQTRTTQFVPKDRRATLPESAKIPLAMDKVFADMAEEVRDSKERQKRLQQGVQ